MELLGYFGGFDAQLLILDFLRRKATTKTSGNCGIAALLSLGPGLRKEKCDRIGDPQGAVNPLKSYIKDGKCRSLPFDLSTYIFHLH